MAARMAAAELEGMWALKVVVRSTFLHAEFDGEVEDIEERGRNGYFPRRRAASLPAGRRAADPQPPAFFVYGHDAAAVVGDRSGRGVWRRPGAAFATDVVVKPTGDRGAKCAATAPGCVEERSWQSNGSSTASGGSSTTAAASDNAVAAAAAAAAAWPGTVGKSVAQKASARTTVMMRNVPTRFSRRALLDLITEEGFRQEVDFIYMPFDFRTGAITGFAFVNLITFAAAERFRAHFHRFSHWGVRTGRVCNVSWARDDQQGLEANVARYRNSSVMHSSVAEEHRPLILDGGAPVIFPRPNKRLNPPSSCFGGYGHGRGGK